MTAALLKAADPTVRVEAIRALRYRDLKDPGVLDALLACCRDPTPAPGSQATSADPFADFFGAATLATAATVGQIAVERLERAGLPPTLDTLDALARALSAEPPHGPLPQATVTLLGETRWPDLDEALRRVIPPLQTLDVPLYALVARLPEAGWATLCELACAPWVPRTFNELLNHPPVRAQAIRTLEGADEAGTLGVDPGQAASILGTLLAWADPAALRLARRWEDRWPWTVAFAALEDPEVVPALAAWLSAGAEGAPDDLGPILADTLRHRGSTPGYPIAAVLEWLGSDPGLVAVWGVDDAVAEVLAGWSQGVAAADLSAWEAVAHLARSGRLARVARHVDTALADTTLPVPWESGILRALAEAQPPPEGLSAAIARGLRAAPDQVVPALDALHALDDVARRAAVEAILDAAEVAPRVEAPAGRGTVRFSSQGVDVEAVAPLVEALADDALAARLEDVMPVIRGR